MSQANAEQALREHIRMTGDISLVNNSDVLMPLYHELGEPRFNEICKEEGFDLDKYSDNAALVYSAVMKLNEVSETEQQKLAELLMPNEPVAIGEFLLAHLRLEYIMDTIITEHNKVTNTILPPEKMAYTFADKIKALPMNILLDDVVINALKGINKLRNKYVHKIKFDINTFEDDGITRALRGKLPAGAKERYTSIMKLIDRMERILLLQVPSLSGELDIIFEQNPVIKKLLTAFKKGHYKDIHEALWRM